MQTYISLLRGINVGPYNRIKMTSLEKIYADLGFFNIHIYIQSGNIVFQTNNNNCDLLAQSIHDHLSKETGIDVPIIVLELRKLEAIVAENPFSIKETFLLHFTFLSEKIDIEKANQIDFTHFSPDQVSISHQVVYLYSPSGYGKTKLTNTYFENKFKTKATTRNWQTTLKLLEIAHNITI